VDTATGVGFVGHGFGSNAADDNSSYPNSLPTEYVPGAGATEFGQKTDQDTPERGSVIDPAGVAVDRANNKLYAADDVAGPDPANSQSDAITRFDIASGNVEEFLSTDQGQLAGLRGIAVDPSGDYVYAAAAGENVVYKLSPSLSILGRFGFPQSSSNPNEGQGTFADVWDVDVDAGHSVWVSDRSSNLIQFFWFPFGPD
jgi:DNA-binding beta-propeller fold protein YncE